MRRPVTAPPQTAYAALAEAIDLLKRVHRDVAPRVPPHGFLAPEQPDYAVKVAEAFDAACEAARLMEEAKGY